MTKKSDYQAVDELTYELAELVKSYEDKVDDPVIIAGVMLAVAMAKMKNLLDEEEFDVFMSQFEDIKNIVKEEEGNYQKLQTKFDLESLMMTTMRSLHTLKKVWTIWKYAIGSFPDDKTEDHDNYVAIIRTFVVLINVVCAFLLWQTLYTIGKFMKELWTEKYRLTL